MGLGIRLEFAAFIANRKGLEMTIWQAGLSTGFLLWTSFFSPDAAFGQTGSDPLAAICQGFLSSSGLPAPGNSSVLCGCLVREVQTNLTVAEMQSYQNATAAGRALPPDVQNKITSIAARCLNAAK